MQKNTKTTEKKKKKQKRQNKHKNTQYGDENAYDDHTNDEYEEDGEAGYAE